MGWESVGKGAGWAKVRAVMIAKDGTRKLATRTLGRKQFSMNLKAA